MNFIKRGLQHLWAKKGKTLLLWAVFSAILVFVLAGLTIRSAATTAIDEAKKSAGATVTLSANREAAFKKMETDSSDNTSRPDPGSFTLTPVNLSDAEKIAKLSGVKNYSFESSTSASAGDGITAISAESTSESESSQTGGQGGPPGMANTQQGDFQIKGVSNSALASEFSAGTAKLISGSALAEADENTNHVLLEKSLAEANDLAVGDTFKLKNADDDTTYEMTVKGIYETSDNGNSMGMQVNMMNPANTLYTSYTFANTVKGTDAKDTIDSAVYTLSDPKEMDTFVKQAKKLVDTDTYSVQSNDQMYQQMLQPLNNIASFSKNVVILVSIAGIIILALIVMLTIRERRYEIGVLLSLGESRFKIILQFFTEIVVCMFLALGIAAASGNVVGDIVGQQLAEQQETVATPAGNEPGGNEGPQGQGGNQAPGGAPSQNGTPEGNIASQAEKIENLDIKVKPKELGLVALAGLGISLGAVLLASIGIIRLNPKKILIS